MEKRPQLGVDSKTSSKKKIAKEILTKPKSKAQKIADAKRRGDHEWLNRNTASGLKAVCDENGNFMYRVPDDSMMPSEEYLQQLEEEEKMDNLPQIKEKQ